MKLEREVELFEKKKNEKQFRSSHYPDWKYLNDPLACDHSNHNWILSLVSRTTDKCIPAFADKVLSSLLSHQVYTLLEEYQ